MGVIVCMIYALQNNSLMHWKVHTKKCVVNEMYDNTALETSGDKAGTKNGY